MNEAPLPDDCTAIICPSTERNCFECCHHLEGTDE